MAEQVNTEIMETIRWGLGIIIVGIGTLGAYLWNLATKLTSHDKDIEEIKNDITEMKKVQEQHEVRHDEIIKKIDESSKYIAEEFRKTSEKMRTYFDNKYQTLETRIYDQKK